MSLVAAGNTRKIPAVLLGRHVPHAWEGPPGDKLDPAEGMLGVRKGMQTPRVRASPQDARREGNGQVGRSGALSALSQTHSELSRKIRAWGARIKSQIQPLVAV